MLLHYFKIACSLVLLACLFLPLASCQYQVPEGKHQQMVDKTQYFYVVPEKTEKNQYVRYAPAIVFLLPLLLSLLSLFQRIRHYAWQLLASLSGMLIIAYVLVYAYSQKLEAGGYLSIIAATLYIVASISSFVVSFRQRKHVSHTD